MIIKRNYKRTVTGLKMCAVGATFSLHFCLLYRKKQVKPERKTTLINVTNYSNNICCTITCYLSLKQFYLQGSSTILNVKFKDFYQTFWACLCHCFSSLLVSCLQMVKYVCLRFSQNFHWQHCYTSASQQSLLFFNLLLFQPVIIAF